VHPTAANHTYSNFLEAVLGLSLAGFIVKESSRSYRPGLRHGHRVSLRPGDKEELLIIPRGI